MHTIESLKNSVIGIFIGNSVACTILILVKEPDFMRFWGFAGYILFPIYVFLFFLLPFASFKFLERKSKLWSLIRPTSFLTIGLLFALVYILFDKRVGSLVENLTDRIPIMLENSFVGNLVFYGIVWFIYPLILFWIIVYLVYIFTFKRCKKCAK